MRPIFLFLTFVMMTLVAKTLAQNDDDAGRFGTSHNGAGVADGLLSGSCALCHNPGTLMLRTESGELCYPCHGSIREKSAKAIRHVDVVSEKFPGLACEGCHRLHKAPGAHLLAAEERELCGACHEDALHGKTHPVVSYIDKRGVQSTVFGSDGRVVTCASHCHDIHGTDHGFLCRLEPGRELCISCHQEYE